MAAKTKPRKIPGASARDVTIANALGDAAYGPQVSGVQDLFRQAQRQYASDIDAAKANAAATIAAVRSARKPTTDIYTEAARSAANTASDIDASVASRLGTANPVSNLLNASIARERGTQSNRVSNEKAGALNELQQRMVGAQAGRQLGVNQARSTLDETKSTLSQKLQDILGARGAKVAAEMGKLVNTREATKAKNAAAGADIYTSGAFTGKTKAEVRSMSPTQRQQIVDSYNAHKGSGGKKGGKGYRATAEKQQSFSDQVSQALRYAKANVGTLSRSAMADILLKGQTPTKEDPQGQIPKFGQTIASIALDQAYDGHISKRNQDRLHRLGLKVSDLADVTSVKAGRQQDLSSKYGWGQ